MIKLNCIQVGDKMGETKIFNSGKIEEALIEDTVKEVFNILSDCGYNPVNQIVGYLISGDPGYISSHKEARSKISEFERTKILELLVEEFIHNK